MTGKKWFYWLGKLHGSRQGFGKYLHLSWPEWAYDAYLAGWYVGHNEATV